MTSLPPTEVNSDRHPDPGSPARRPPRRPAQRNPCRPRHRPQRRCQGAAARARHRAGAGRRPHPRPGPGGPGIAEGPSLLIVGPTGTGKTYRAYGAVRALLTRGVRLRREATTTADLYARLRPRPGHDAERNLQALARSPLLLLDDLGAAKTSEWTEELTYRLINHRYEHLRPTLITTNLPTAELRTVLGDRIASRLAEMTERVILTGPDRRRSTPAARPR